ncbi:hypothetical protein SDJN02_11101, partial [Cucurbita argyrosperma subsp. argyrosperma]
MMRRGVPSRKVVQTNSERDPHRDSIIKSEKKANRKLLRLFLGALYLLFLMIRFPIVTQGAVNQ